MCSFSLLSSIFVFSPDGSESAVLDFCTLLHARPDLLRNSCDVRGMTLSDDGVLDEDDTDSTSRPCPPMDDAQMHECMQTVDKYLAMRTQQQQQQH